MNDYASVETSGNEMGEGEGGEAVPCVHIYAMPDGSFKVERSEAPAPMEAESAGDMDSLMSLLPGMLAPADMEAEEVEKDAARQGYARRASRSMEAPSLGMVFGE